MPSIFVLSAAAAAVALLGFFFVRRFVKPIDLVEHKDFLDAMLTIVGTLVSILLGLLVAAALDHYQTLEQSVDNEAADMAQIYRLSFGLPDKTGQNIRDLDTQYQQALLNDEWPKMSQGLHSDKAFTIYARLVVTIARFRPANNGETNIHASLISAVQQAGDCRRQRLLALHSRWTANLLPILIICAAIVLTFTYLYVRRGEVFHGVLICFVAVALGSNLGLIFLLNNPFNGDWKIQPKGFELNRKFLDELKTNPELIELIKDNQEPQPGPERN